MILADHEIRRLCEKFGMVTPFESDTVREKDGLRCLGYGLDAAGYDLRLGSEVKFFSKDSEQIIDPKNFLEDGLYLRKVEADGSMILPSGTTALAPAVEKFKMPANVWALVIAKSTYARCGVTLNATKINPGWEGELVLEISNMTPRPVKIYPGEGIASIVFFWVNPPDLLYGDRGGNYQGQKGVTLAKA